MTLPRIAINGFGRIGRTIIRISKQHHQFDVVAVNDLSPIDDLAYAFKYDSIHGTYSGDVSFDDTTMTIDGDAFQVLAEPNLENLNWGDLGVDYVIESTGRFRNLSDLEHHTNNGAKRVILTVPAKDPLPATLVMGVNDHVVDQDSRIISNASCTTNCAAPLAKILNDAFGIESGLLTTIHAYTSDQRLVDSPHKDKRRSRSAAVNIVPTSTGAARAIGDVIPELKGKIDGMAMRVPVPDGSLVDFTLKLSRSVTVDDINQAMYQAAETNFKDIVQCCEDPIVSSDIMGNCHSSIYDVALTQVMDDSLVKVVSWYDNEWGYSSRVAQLIDRLATMDAIQ